MLSDAELDRQFGRTARLGFRQAEKEAVAGVETFLIHHELDVDRHSKGETVLAHRPKHMEHFRRKTDAVFENYGVEAEFIEPEALPRQGIQGGPFFGAMTIPIGFALNPRKYLAGLMTEAMSLGVRLFSNSPVASLRRASGGCKLVLAQGTVNADQVIVATNGYSSENLPDWLAGRFMPGQSTVLVTRPLTRDELSQQGWTTTQMCYDSRNLLHYFRLLPDGRFLFGMRGGLLTGARAEATARARTRRDFENMFPAWQQVESTYSWSGMVSLARNRLPFVGQIPGYEGMWAAMCYHGNGVAMGSYAGGMVAGLLTGRPSETYPLVMQRPLRRFPLGGARRGLMPPLYALLKLQDWV
jgi:glycine/D-amino acid oxidase-like deaminating enzyme